MTAWHAITCLGDSALLLPLIIWIAIWLLLQPLHRGDGLRWLVAAVLCGGLVAISKLLFMAWGIGPSGINYTGFSGHTALSLLVWPSLASLLAREDAPRQRMLATMLGGLIGAGVAVSRLALKVHSSSEVWLGAALGIATATWFLHGLSQARSIPIPSLAAAKRRPVLLGGVLVVGLFCYGRVFPSQHLLQDIALWLSGHPNIFTRRMRLG